MIFLSDNDYIGEGEIRVCYQHPHNKNVCVKVPKQAVSRAYTLKEIIYFKKLNNRRLKHHDYQFYSNFKGEIQTNKGLAQLFDLVRDEDTGNVSKTLEYYLIEDKSLPLEILENALKSLKDQMYQHRVFLRDLRARNLCCKKNIDGSVQLVIIDGIGHRDFIPLADTFDYYTRKKIERIFNRRSFNSIIEQKNHLNKKIKLKA